MCPVHQPLIRSWWAWFPRVDRVGVTAHSRPVRIEPIVVKPIGRHIRAPCQYVYDLNHGCLFLSPSLRVAFAMVAMFQRESLAARTRYFCNAHGGCTHSGVLRL